MKRNLGAWKYDDVDGHPIEISMVYRVPHCHDKHNV